MEYVLNTCLLSVELGKDLHLSQDQLKDIYYLALLHFIGCTSSGHLEASIFGDEMAVKEWMAPIGLGTPAEFVGAVIRNMGKGEPLLRRGQSLAHALVRMPKLTETTWSHCEVGQRLAQRMGFGPAIQEALFQINERWDGKGMPKGLKGQQISLPMRLVALVQNAEIPYRFGGVEAAVQLVRNRAGGAYDPELAERFCALAQRLYSNREHGSVWEAVLAAEPGEPIWLAQDQIEETIRPIADFVDLKSPYFSGHSSGVAELASAAAELCKLPRDDVVAVRWAGYLHDLGRLSVATAIWEKPGQLSDGEWERVRLHPYYTERILARCPGLRPICAIATLHHERLNGSGYHRGIAGSQLSAPARLLAAADVYHALMEPRPHRPAHTAEAAVKELLSEVRLGRLDGEAVEAVLKAAGHRLRRVRSGWVAGLSEREIEVLRLIARGRSNRQMAASLSISPKTVGRHIEHIYEKLSVSTRAAATLFALQHGLVDTTNSLSPQE
jgi:HD-GYP domain-containing protein (c-di-GMP phosphodiesterase class II)